MITARKTIFAFVVMSLMAVAPVAWGSAFVNPPENNGNITWETQLPYQRNILLDFSQNPVAAAGNGIHR